MLVKKIKVMLVDDQMLLREGLRTIINLHDDMEVVAEADNGKLATEIIVNTTVDVILMDICMPILNGVEATSIIKQEVPGVEIIILTTFDDDDYIIEALSKGAAGYLLKDMDANHLVDSIRDVYKGQLMLPSKVATKLALRIATEKNYLSKPIQSSPEGLQLSEREKEIGQLMATGFSNSQIARKLFLSEGTVKNYVSELYQKLGTNNRTKAAILIKQILE